VSIVVDVLIMDDVFVVFFGLFFSGIVGCSEIGRFVWIIGGCVCGLGGVGG